MRNSFFKTLVEISGFFYAHIFPVTNNYYKIPLTMANKRKRYIKDTLIITPLIKQHLLLLKWFYNKNYIDGNPISINDQIIMLREKGLTRKEICEELGITMKALESRITRINKKIVMENPIELIIDNTAKVMVSMVRDMIVCAKEERYEHAQAIKELIEDNIRLTATELVELTGLEYDEIYNKLQEQKDIIHSKMIEE